LAVHIVPPGIHIAVALAQSGDREFTAGGNAVGARQISSAAVEHGALAGYHLAGHIGVKEISFTVSADAQLASVVSSPGIYAAIRGPGQYVVEAHADFFDEA